MCRACAAAALRTTFPCTHRREVQEYIPAQLYCTTAGSAWLNLVSQHRQQTQALSPHQARTQFLGKSPTRGENRGGFAQEGSRSAGMEALFSLHKGIFSASQAEHQPGENTFLKSARLRMALGGESWR